MDRLVAWNITTILLINIVIIISLSISKFDDVYAKAASTEEDIRQVIREELKEMLFDESSTEGTSDIQEIDDPVLDFVDLYTRQYTRVGYRAPDIVTVNYFSNKKSFNATLWLRVPFNDKPLAYEKVNYGMYIDADLDKNTGFAGIDYKIEISWDNNSQRWSKTLDQLSAFGEERTLQHIDNYKNFFRNNSRYVTMSIDLNTMQLQKNYLVSFYAESKRPLGHLITDFSRQVSMPRPFVSVSAHPSDLIIRAGETKSVLVNVNSSIDHAIKTVLNTTPSLDVVGTFQTGNLTLPPLGIRDTQLVLFASKNALMRQYIFPIVASSTILSKNFTNSHNTAAESFSKYIIPEEVLSAPYFINLTVLPPLTFADQFAKYISGISLLTFLIIPTLFSAKPIFTKKLPDLIDLAHTEILSIDVAIIAGALIFLSLEGFEGSQITFITANIVFPFAISAIMALAKLTKFKKFATRLTIAGFINLMVSIILIAFIKS